MCLTIPYLLQYAFFFQITSEYTVEIIKFYLYTVSENIPTIFSSKKQYSST